MEAFERHIRVRRTARYFLLGTAGPHIRRVWYVLHGYGQLASFFIRHFEVVLDEKTLVVAPEALSRFYSDGTSGRVGATWMTREDRLNEIEDYVGYLDEVHASISREVPEGVETVLLGFSQGTATAWRWLKKGKVNVRHLVNWAGGVPAEMTAEWLERLENTSLYTVLGDQDQYISPEDAARQIGVLRQLRPDLHYLQFEGDHRMDAATLKMLNDLIDTQD